MNKTQVRIGHTPDADDAFMFYGFQTGASQIDGFEIKHIIEDIDSLNLRACGNDPLECTALSLNAYLGLRHRYEMMPVGTSVGREYGPRVISNDALTINELRERKIALPGRSTTASLVATMLLPPFQPIYTRFDFIPELVKTGQVDAGVVIHEAQLTFQNLGFNLVCDLGKLFSDRCGGLPLPLGVNAIRLDLDSGLRSAITVAYRDSIKFAMSERINAIRYSMQYSRGVNEKLTDEFVGMYVNEDSLNISADVKKAIDVLAEFYEKNNSTCE